MLYRGIMIRAFDVIKSGEAFYEGVYSSILPPKEGLIEYIKAYVKERSVEAPTGASDNVLLCFDMLTWCVVSWADEFWWIYDSKLNGKVFEWIILGRIPGPYYDKAVGELKKFLNQSTC